MSRHLIRTCQHLLYVNRGIARIGLQQNAVNSTSRAFSSSNSTRGKLQVGDRVLLRWKQSKSIKLKLTKPLREDGETIVHNHTIKHSELIGQEPDTQLFKVSKDGSQKLSVYARHPSLDEFTALSPRLVAPIYATYAQVITSLLDIHLDPCGPENHPETVGGPTFQILEAGTGHGSLTLHLAREIAAANPPVTKDVRPPSSKLRIMKGGEEQGDSDRSESEALVNWRRQRRAVLNTVDIVPANRAHADELIRSFRGGMYWPHVDFFARDVKDWLGERQESAQAGPFLDRIILDMPDVEQYIASVVDSLKDRGLLLVFVPQITQIATCVQKIVTKDLGLRLEKVVELGDGISNGRLWDVRMAKIRNPPPPKRVAEEADTTEEPITEVSEGAVVRNDLPSPSVGTIPPMICRPMVGESTRGGGFVGLWKRTVRSNEPVSDEASVN